jgi:polysaccharide export outer membrane protein
MRPLGKTPSPGLIATCLAVAVLLAGAGACGGRLKYDFSKEPDPRRAEYVLGAADRIRIDVWRNQELSGETTIRADGNITMPMVGDLRAAGRTPSSLRDEIKQRLAKFFQEAVLQVTVAVVATNSYRFTVNGNVLHPGIITPTTFVTVLEAIALAGGPTRFADPAKMLVIRTDASGQTRRIPIDYEALRSGERMEQNIVILSGDSIYVP